MSRIAPVDPASSTTPAESRQLMDAFKAKVGMVPNLLKSLAHSPTALKFYLGGSDTLAHGALPGGLREQLAIAIADANGCDYCLSAHTALGKMANVSAEDLLAARSAGASNPKDAAALSFAQAVVSTRGRVSDTQLQAVRQAGYTDAQIAEIVAVVAINIFTNYFNHVADTEVDFPRLRAGH